MFDEFLSDTNHGKGYYNYHTGQLNQLPPVSQRTLQVPVDIHLGKLQ